MRSWGLCPRAGSSPSWAESSIRVPARRAPEFRTKLGVRRSSGPLGRRRPTKQAWFPGLRRPGVELRAAVGGREAQGLRNWSPGAPGAQGVLGQGSESAHARLSGLRLAFQKRRSTEGSCAGRGRARTHTHTHTHTLVEGECRASPSNTPGKISVGVILEQ